MIRLVIIFIAWAITTGCYAQTDEDFDNGSLEINKKNFEKAIAYLDKAINRSPTNERALLLRSRAHYALKHYEMAIIDCDSILKINSGVFVEEDFSAICNLGTIYNSLRQFDNARYNLNKAIQLSPHNIKLYEEIGYSYLEEKKYDLALKQFESIVSINKQSEKGFYGIGKVYLLKGQYKEAIQNLDLAIGLNPNYGIAYQNRGSAKFELNDVVGGCLDWYKCLDLGIIMIKPLLKSYCE